MGEVIAVRFCKAYASPLGELLLTGDGEALTGLYFAGQKYAFSGEMEKKELPVFRETAAWLDCYFSGGIPDFLPLLRPEGTAFRREVWALLQAIPYGETRSYGELAALLAKARGAERFSAQAVGGAVGHNPISLLIPCHRVVGADGSLTGYAGGVERKAWLLAWEAQHRA